MREDDPSDLYLRAVKSYGLGMVAEAETICRKCLALESAHSGALRLLAAIANASGRSLEAGELLARASRALPHDVAVHVDLGHVLFGMGRVEEAAMALSRAVSSDPTHVEALTSLGGVLAQLGRTAEGESALRRALTLDSRCARAHFNLGELLRSTGRMFEARESLESALRLAPQEQLTRLACADVLYEVGEFDSAVRGYREFLAKDSGSATIYTKFGLALLMAGNQTEALEALRTAVALDPNSADARVVRAWALLQYGRVHEAIASADAAVSLARHPTGHMLHGVALATLGEFDEGIARFRLGFGPAKSSSDCLASMGSWLQQLGHADAARACLHRALELEPASALLRHEVAALSGGDAPDRASDAYVVQVFDSVADSFDHHLVGRLNYAAPQLVRDAVLAGRPTGDPLDVLDLGCGTGLAGVELKPHARSLVGVDLSERMLQHARGLNIYTRLVRDNLEAALAAEMACSYDVVVAVDVMIYFGRLDEVVSAVHRVLRPRGLFVFTVEADRTEPSDRAGALRGYRLTGSGRYTHTANYVVASTSRSAFEIKTVRDVRLRSESWRPVIGLLVAVARTD
jgi:predicted TPR repeat methyltransferase